MTTDEIRMRIAELADDLSWIEGDEIADIARNRIAELQQELDTLIAEDAAGLAENYVHNWAN